MTTSEKAPPPPTVWHSLSYRDARAAITFLTEAFGFQATAVYADAGDSALVVHAQLDWPAGGGIMLGSAPPPDGWPDPAGHSCAYCVIDGTGAEVDALFARATTAGATVLREPRDESYGGRSFVVTDPEGNQWSFGTYRGE
jgi:uncharacterized glyoxalase superfamily protein PhnB